MVNLRQTPVIFFEEKSFWTTVFCSTLLILSSACESLESTDLTEAASPSQASDESVTPVPLEIGDWRRVEELIREHAGQIVVVDLWSTSCPPCIQEFPDFVALQQRQLTYLLERCNSFAAQATLVTGFSFTSFSAEALEACISTPRQPRRGR